MANGDVYNTELCREKHKAIDRRFEAVAHDVAENRSSISSLKNWIIATLTTAIMTLVGVAAVLLKELG